MRSRIVVVVLGSVLAAAMVVAAPPQQLTAHVDYAGTQLALAPSVTGTAAHLVVAGPGGLRLERTFAAREPIAVNLTEMKGVDGQPATLGDGDYKWELRVSTLVAATGQQEPEGADSASAASSRQPAGTRLEVWVGTGQFKVVGGGVVSLQPEPQGHGMVATTTGLQPGGQVSEQGMSVTPLTAFTGYLYNTGGICAGCADADPDLASTEVLVKSGVPAVTLRDFTNDQLWRWTTISATPILALYGSRLNGTTTLIPVKVEADTPTNTLYLDSTGAVGIGTPTPVEGTLTLMPTGNSFSSTLNFVSGSYGYQFYYNVNGYFGIGTTASGNCAFCISPTYQISNTLNIDGGNVGIHTLSPDSVLHVNATTVGSDGAAAGSAVHIRQNTVWSGAQPWAMFVEGYTNLGGFRINAADGQRGFHKVYSGGQFGFSTQGNDPITFTQLATQERMRIAPGGHVGIGTATPTHLLDVGVSGAYCNGGIWYDGSSRAFKEDIQDLSTEAAEEAFAKLTPVTYAYKATPEEHHVGFIAEDVPDLVATPDRKALSAMDVVAVLTKVVQQQQKTIAELQVQVAELRRQK